MLAGEFGRADRNHEVGEQYLIAIDRGGRFTVANREIEILADQVDQPVAGIEPQIDLRGQPVKIRQPAGKPVFGKRRWQGDREVVACPIQSQLIGDFPECRETRA